MHFCVVALSDATVSWWLGAYRLIDKLENVVINDVLPLKAARRGAIANLKRFWGLGHQKRNFDGYIYIYYAAPPYSARISAINYLLPFGNVWLVSVCRVQRLGTKQNAKFTEGG